MKYTMQNGKTLLIVSGGSIDINFSKEYIKDKGMDKIREHAKDFITKRLAPKVINNDGKQTPYKGHPVFISQHATATCCRSCLYKWHKIDMNKTLSEEEINYIVNLIMKWIENENKNN